MDLENRLRVRKETLQPIIVITGSETNIEESYVVINSFHYKCSTCLDALDLNFKIFFSLDCAYPKASATLWKFIQIVAYDIQLLRDVLIKSIKELLGLSRQKLQEAASLTELENQQNLQ